MRPQTSYLIFATPRSGSYLLCEALANTHLAGLPIEYFGAPAKSYMKRWYILQYADYIQKLLTTTTTPNGVFGAKIIWQFFEFFLDDLREMPGYAELATPELLKAVFPDLHFIWITRHDKVRQAVSYSKAMQTQVWYSFDQQTQQVSEVEPIFHFKVIDHLLQSIIKDEEEMQQFFTKYGIQPYTVVYEEFSTAYQETARNILEFLQIPVPQQLVFQERKLKRQGNRQNDEWVQRYHQYKTQSPALDADDINLLDYFYQVKEGRNEEK